MKDGELQNRTQSDMQSQIDVNMSQFYCIVGWLDISQKYSLVLWVTIRINIQNPVFLRGRKHTNNQESVTTCYYLKFHGLLSKSLLIKYVCFVFVFLHRCYHCVQSEGHVCCTPREEDILRSQLLYAARRGKAASVLIVECRIQSMNT